MPRPRERLCLEQGLKLDLNQLIQQGTLRRGAKIGPYVITWTNSHTGEVVAVGLISGAMEGQRGGWLHVQIGELDQWIDLVAEPRHFGGRQWYFKCFADQRCSVLWRFGNRHFCSRAALGRQFAYASQFATPLDRAHRGQAKIKARLLGDCNPDEWHLPPKPNRMRWHTYNKYVDKFDQHETTLDALISGAALRLLRRV